MAKKSLDRGTKDKGEKHSVDRGDSGKSKSRPGTSVSTRTENPDENQDGVEETYAPSGDFEKDYTELCQRMGLEPVRILPRPHPPGTPVAAQPEPTNVKEKGKRDHSQTPQHHHHQQQQLQQQQQQKTEGEESLPTTYTTKEKFEYFKPRIEVETEDEGNSSHVREIYIRGWKVDKKMTEVFGLTLPKQERLTTIDFWNTGLTDETLESLSKIVSTHPTLRHLRLDGNGYLIQQRFDELLKDESRLHSLSLKNCYVNDVGAQHLGAALSTNKNLLMLNLCFNKVTCVGAEHLAKGLRLNRTLLSLNLGSNRIGDAGAIKLAQTISKFALSHEEIVARRMMLSKGGTPEEPASPSRSLATTVSRENRPQSVKSGSHVAKDDKKRDKGGSKKKDQQSGKAGKDTPAGKRGAGANSEAGKGNAKGGKKAANVKQEKGRQSQSEQEQPEYEFLHPYMETVEEVNKELWIPGNRALVNLNLARNNIGETGMKALLDAVKYQTELANQANRTSGVGLMRLSLQKNNFNSENPLYLQLQEVMHVRDPFYKPPPASPSGESIKDEN